MAAKRETNDGPSAEVSSGYAEALDELEAILAQLEDGDLDVDVLASRVERAAALLNHCRSRLDAAQVEVERVVASLEAETDD
jgi:exodeoxyribonuclease VII small subunit